MATFQIFQSSGQYWYHLRAANSEIVQSGEGYTSKASCENGIQSVKANQARDHGIQVVLREAPEVPVQDLS